MYPNERKQRGSTGIRVEDYSSKAEYRKQYAKQYREKFGKYWKEYYKQHKSESKRQEIVRKILDAFDYFKFREELQFLEAEVKNLRTKNNGLLQQIKKSVDERLNQNDKAKK